MSMDISKMKLPERMLLLDDFPLSGFGKVSKKLLAEMAVVSATQIAAAKS